MTTWPVIEIRTLLAMSTLYFLMNVCVFMCACMCVCLCVRVHTHMCNAQSRASAVEIRLPPAGPRLPKALVECFFQNSLWHQLRVTLGFWARVSFTSFNPLPFSFWMILFPKINWTLRRSWENTADIENNFKRDVLRKHWVLSVTQLRKCRLGVTVASPDLWGPCGATIALAQPDCVVPTHVSVSPSRPMVLPKSGTLSLFCVGLSICTLLDIA